MLRKTDVEPLPDRKDDDEGTPVSVKIRERITAAHVAEALGYRPRMDDAALPRAVERVGALEETVS